MQVTLFSMRKIEGQHDTSHRGCIMRKAMSKEVGAGGRFDIFLDSDLLLAQTRTNPGLKCKHETLELHHSNKLKGIRQSTK